MRKFFLIINTLKRLEKYNYIIYRKYDPLNSRDMLGPSEKIVGHNKYREAVSAAAKEKKEGEIIHHFSLKADTNDDKIKEYMESDIIPTQDLVQLEKDNFKTPEEIDKEKSLRNTRWALIIAMVVGFSGIILNLWELLKSY